MADRVVRSVRVPVFMVVACALFAVAASSAAAAGKVSSPAPLPPVGGQLQYYGGRVVSNIRVVQVLWGADASVGATSPEFYGAIVGSPYLGWLNGDYGTTNPAPWVPGSTKTDQTIGLGSYDAVYSITPSNTQTTVTDSDVQTELSAQIAAGHLPAPVDDAAGNNNTYYAISFPSTVRITLGGLISCFDFGAYHSAVADVGGGYGEVYYGVIPACFNETADDQTFAASHELVETITDPEGGLATGVYPNGSPPNAWFGFGSAGDFVIGPEIADTCPWSGRLDGTGFAVSLEWSNSASACILTLPAPITTSTAPSFTLGVPAAFTITTSDPLMTFADLQVISSLPGGVSLVDNHDGTATVAGTPLTLDTYQLWATASNASGLREVKPFILTVNAPSMTGFMSPLAKTTLKAGATIPVKFVLTSATGTPINSSVSATLAGSGIVTATLSGSSINPQSTTCTWNTAGLYFQCNIKSPSTLPTGPANAYTITASVNSAAGTAIPIPALGSATNPETIYFK